MLYEMECEKCECKNMKGNENEKWMWMQDSMGNVRCYELYKMECEYEALWNMKWQSD